MIKPPYKIDVPVLLIFFCRPGPFSQTFNAVRRARPSKLYLYQDGPREGAAHDSDLTGIEACRQIVETGIDWDCEVHTKFQAKNVGCDPSEYLAQKWMFETEERGIILEDDDVAMQSFFPYCAELLEKYKNDERIAMVSGRNQLGGYHPHSGSYFFSSTCSICGWATWKRVVDTWEEHYDSLDDEYVVKCLKENFKDEALDKHIATMFAQKEDGRAFYETILGLSRFAQHRLTIVPCVNMIQNVGNVAGATHLNDPNGRTYTIPVGDSSFPLIHPKYVMDDKEYSRLVTEGPSIARRLVSKMKKILKGGW